MAYLLWRTSDFAAVEQSFFCAEGSEAPRTASRASLPRSDRDHGWAIARDLQIRHLHLLPRRNDVPLWESRLVRSACAPCKRLQPDDGVRGSCIYSSGTSSGNLRRGSRFVLHCLLCCSLSSLNLGHAGSAYQSGGRESSSRAVQGGEDQVQGAETTATRRRHKQTMKAGVPSSSTCSAFSRYTTIAVRPPQ